MAISSCTDPNPTAGPTPGPAAIWTRSTLVVAWCATCGTDVEFALPSGPAPADLAADERACVWCGEALVLGGGHRDGHVDGTVVAA